MMPRKDINQIAFDVVQKATGEIEMLAESVKSTSGRKGGLKGGNARAQALPAKKRSEIAKKAAIARWHKP
jgi:hypothetical protein